MRDFFAVMEGWTQSIQISQDGQTRQARGFVQPVSLSDPEREKTPTRAGCVDERRYLLITEPGAISAQGGRKICVEACGRSFELLRCELMGGGSHWEGIMRLKAGGENA